MFDENSKVGEILARYPQTEEVFYSFGFTELKNPVMRATVAKFATLKMASERKNVELDVLIKALEIKIEES